MERNLKCDTCCRDVFMVTVEEATMIVNATDRTIYRWDEQGKIHTKRMTNGQIRICPISLEMLAVPGETHLHTFPLNPKIIKAIRLIDEQYHQPNLTLGSLAEQLNISVWYLSRLFKQHTGMGFRQYVRILRMRKAKESLHTTMLSIKEIAAAVGYKYVSDFDQHFRLYTGMTPGEYRQREAVRQRYVRENRAAI